MTDGPSISDAAAADVVVNDNTMSAAVSSNDIFLIIYKPIDLRNFLPLLVTNK